MITNDGKTFFFIPRCMNAAATRDRSVTSRLFNPSLKNHSPRAETTDVHRRTVSLKLIEVFKIREIPGNPLDYNVMFQYFKYKTVY